MGTAAIRRHQGGIDDGAAFHQMWQGSFGDVKIGENICTEGFVQLLGRNIFQAVLWILNRRVIDNDIKSLQFLDRLLDRALTKFLIPYISRDQKAGLPILFYKRSSFLRVFVLILYSKPGWRS